MHHCHYGLGPLCAHMEEVHTYFILVTIMHDTIKKSYHLGIFIYPQSYSCEQNACECTKETHHR